MRQKFPTIKTTPTDRRKWLWRSVRFGLWTTNIFAVAYAILSWVGATCVLRVLRVVSRSKKGTHMTPLHRITGFYCFSLDASVTQNSSSHQLAPGKVSILISNIISSIRTGLTLYWYTPRKQDDNIVINFVWVVTVKWMVCMSWSEKGSSTRTYYVWKKEYLKLQARLRYQVCCYSYHETQYTLNC